MKFPQLFKRGKGGVSVQPTQDRAQKAFVDSLRALSRVFSKLADLVEKQRLERAGYEQQDKYLERLDEGAQPQPGKRS